MAVLGPAQNLDLYSKTWQNNGGSVEEWQHEKHHQLPEGYPHYYIRGAAEGYLLLVGDCNIETTSISYWTRKHFRLRDFASVCVLSCSPVCKIPTIIIFTGKYMKW